MVEVVGGGAEACKRGVGGVVLESAHVRWRGFRSRKWWVASELPKNRPRHRLTTAARTTPLPRRLQAAGRSCFTNTVYVAGGTTAKHTHKKNDFRLPVSWCCRISITETNKLLLQRERRVQLTHDTYYTCGRRVVSLSYKLDQPAEGQTKTNKNQEPAKRKKKTNYGRLILAVVVC